MRTSASVGTRIAELPRDVYPTSWLMVRTFAQNSGVWARNLGSARNVSLHELYQVDSNCGADGLNLGNVKALLAALIF